MKIWEFFLPLKFFVKSIFPFKRGSHSQNTNSEFLQKRTKVVKYGLFLAFSLAKPNNRILQYPSIICESKKIMASFPSQIVHFSCCNEYEKKGLTCALLKEMTILKIFYFFPNNVRLLFGQQQQFSIMLILAILLAAIAFF